jgi:mono/diheme cytochrome c family protein
MNLSRRASRSLAVVGAAVLMVGLAAQTTPETPPQARGHALVARDCGMCHAVGRVDDSPNSQAPPFRRLHERYPVENLAEALAEGILVGHPQMPEFRFGAGEVGDIIAYLKSIQTDVHAQAVRRAPAVVQSEIHSN